MNASASTNAHEWRELYRAALFEVDEQKLTLRIAEAERALYVRERGLFAMSSDELDEKQAISDARYALRALRSCLELRQKSPRLPENNRISYHD